MGKNNLLDLDGKELEQELDRIAKENPSNHVHWTEKEVLILKKLKMRGLTGKKIAEIIGRTPQSVENKLKRV